MTKRKRVTRGLVIVGLAAWIAAPIAAFAALTLLATSQTLDPPQLVWAPVSANTDEVRVKVDLDLTWGDAGGVIAPAWSGVVQRVSVAPGQELTDGQEVALVDGISRTFAATALPFARSLTAGSTGPDVSQLNAFLQARGFSSPTGNRYTSQTRSAVRAFALSIGVPNPDGTMFDPGWVVFLRAAGLQANKVDLDVGAPAPGAGTSFIGVASRVVTANMSAASADETSDSPTASPTNSPEPSKNASQITATPGQQLEVGVTKIPLVDSRDAPSPDGLKLIGTLTTSKTTKLTAYLVSPASASELVVPSASIFASSGGRLCVVAGSDKTHRDVLVAVVSEEAGRSTVTAPGLHSGDRVLVRPPVNYRSCK